jgi:two-component system NarL family response regulator
MKVLLVDDNRLMLEGLQNLLEAHGVQVAGLASDGLQAVGLARTLQPDVILMDIRMPNCDGLAATRLIKAEMPDRVIVVLTTSTDEQDLFEAVKAGACGYLLKSITADSLIEALHQVQEGVPPFSPGLATKLLKEFAHRGESSPKGLNERQTEVLTLVSQGLSYKEVGTRLFLSPHTVRYHMGEIMNQLHLENRAQVLAYAGRLGIGKENPPKQR